MQFAYFRGRRRSACELRDARRRSASMCSTRTLSTATSTLGDAAAQRFLAFRIFIFPTGVAMRGDSIRTGAATTGATSAKGWNVTVGSDAATSGDNRIAGISSLDRRNMLAATSAHGATSANATDHGCDRMVFQCDAPSMSARIRCDGSRRGVVLFERRPPSIEVMRKLRAHLSAMAHLTQATAACQSAKHVFGDVGGSS